MDIEIISQNIRLTRLKMKFYLPSLTVIPGNLCLNCCIKAAPTGAAAGKMCCTLSMCLSVTPG